ncbi:MAG: MBL fold metallo-hydrolase, partial [Acidimicrobiia bacterium]|nr:MBL fold metallo-hydrolase [Acidimicrobiia bacterium]
MQTWAVGDATITRVEDPGFELVLPQDDATIATLQASPWLAPHFVDGDWSLVVGSTATVIRSGDRTIVVDPFLAFDDPTRLDAQLDALRSAGCDPAEVDVVVNTHVDGIGANLASDGTPAFPNARYLVPREELDALTARWTGEKESINSARDLKEQLEALRGESERAERDGDYAKVAELRYGRIPALEKELEAADEASAAAGP